MRSVKSIITATGSFIPPNRVPNTQFLENSFYDAHGNRLQRSNPEIVQKLLDITGIEERRYAPDEMHTSDMALKAAEAAKNQRAMNIDCIFCSYRLFMPDLRIRMAIFSALILMTFS